MDINKSDILLRDDGSIQLDGEEVGYLGWNENVLVDISVEPKYRCQGIATEAVSQMVEKMKEEGYERITTTSVMSPEMESVLQKVGFESRVEKSPVYDPDELTDEISEADIPMEEEVVWEYFVE